MVAKRFWRDTASATVAPAPKKRAKPQVAVKKTQSPPALRDKHLSSGIIADFGHNALTESWRFGHSIDVARKAIDRK
jgi:hypothetical protein